MTIKVLGSSVSPTNLDLSSIVRRNTMLLSSEQSLFSVSTQLNALVASVAVYQLTSNYTLAGLVSSLVWVGRVVVSYGSGALMDRAGRRPVLVLGSALVASTFFALGISFMRGNVAGMLALFLLYGVGAAICGQNRIAIADMYPSSKTGTALGYLYTSSIVGALLTVIVVAFFGPVASALGLSTYGLLWIVGGALNLPAIIAVLLVRPDTREVAALIGRDEAATLQKEKKRDEEGGSPRSYGIFGAFLVSGMATGIMIAMMSLLSLDMMMAEIPVVFISATISVHVIGMYAPSFPLGWLVDRVGSKTVMVASSLIAGSGGLLAPLTSNYFLITFAMFLVGVGWCGATISTTALIASATRTAERGRILGLNDVTNGAASIASPFLGGLVIAGYGFAGFGLFGLALSVPAIIGALAVKSKHVLPG